MSRQLSKGWLCCSLLLALLVGGTAAAEPLERVRIAADHWPEYTEPDGSGLGFDIMREVFAGTGIRVEFEIMPYLRCQGLVKRGEFDLFMDSYEHEVEGVHYPRWHYDLERVSALGLASRPLPQFERAEQYLLVWRRGYSFNKYAPAARNFREISTGESVLKILDRGHADYYISNEEDMDILLRESRQSQRYRYITFAHLKLFPAFTDSERGRALAAVYDRRMDEPVRRGTLKRYSRQWDEPYPFKDGQARP